MSPYLPDSLVSLDWLGFALVLALIVVVGLLVSLSRLPRPVKLLIYAGLLMRVVGTFGRYYMVTGLYHNVGDSFTYFRWGRMYSDMLAKGDFTSLFDPSVWSGGKWWGTQFIRYLTGLVVALIGPTFVGGFLVYSLLAFVGLIGFGMAFRRVHPELPVGNYLRWIWLFPSLWFWPSGIGKEAVILLGLGLTLWGFAGRGERINWPLLGLGIFLVFAVRVQVAAVVVMSLILAHWLSLGGRWTWRKTVQGVLILTVGLGTMSVAMKQMGVESMDAEGVQEYLEDNAGRGAAGTEDSGTGSAIGGTTVGLTGIPVALVNITMRPFPWEASNPQLLITALEIMSFWGIVWYRRRYFVAGLRYWRTDRLLRVAVPFVLVYSITLGMLLSNMGLIARQRIFIFPFLFLLVETVPRAARNASQAGAVPGRRAGAAAEGPPPLAWSRQP